MHLIFLMYVHDMIWMGDWALTLTIHPTVAKLISMILAPAPPINIYSPDIGVAFVEAVGRPWRPYSEVSGLFSLTSVIFAG